MDAAEASAVTESPEKKPSKGGKTKNDVPSKTGGLKAKSQTNGNAAATKKNTQGKKDLAVGPKKAKMAKMDGEAAKGEKAKKPVVKTAGETKSPEDKKKDGSTLKNKLGEKKKIAKKEGKRMGKNKFKKLRKMLEKMDKKWWTVNGAHK